jgi:hypothetical protein
MSAESELMRLGRAIDNLLVQHHGLRHALKPGHLPLAASLAEGVAQYGEGPLFHLWSECRAVEALRVAWTGVGSPEAVALPAPVPPAQPASEAPQPAEAEAPAAEPVPEPVPEPIAAPVPEPIAAPAREAPVKTARGRRAGGHPPPAASPARAVRRRSGK